MKNQALFSSKDKSKKLKCRLLQFLFGALRVKLLQYQQHLHVFVKVDLALLEVPESMHGTMNNDHR